MRIALGLSYDGTSFYGWQKQKQLRTVQAELESALSKVANESITVVCAGRTDTGVHANEQVVHFDTNVIREINVWMRGGNANLPKDVAIKWARAVDESFHARFSALSREYQYIILNQEVRPTYLRSCVTWYKYHLNVEHMHEAGQLLLGKHDFSSFRGSNCQSPTPVRRVDRLQVIAHPPYIIVDIVANAFLHHMVRNIVGVLVAIGAGKKPVTWASELLQVCDRTSADITMPPQGLYLKRVTY